MAYREVSRMEIQEIIRRWQAGDSQRKIALGTGLSRDTIAKYVAAAQEEGIVRDGLVATAEELSRLATIGQPGPRQVERPGQDLLEPWADQIYQWLTGDRLQLTRIRELLAARGCPVSYPSLRRFVLKRNWRQLSQTTVRMEDTAPGEVAEADFGRLGMIVDPETGRRRAVWGLIIVLGYSRHSFVWPTHGQTLEDIIAGLEAAWVCFGGVPKYLVIDNCPPAVAGPDPLHPRFTRGFLEYSQCRGFIADAAPVRLIVRRVKPTPGSQLALFATYSYHGFITDREGETLELEADHRRHAEIENAIRDLKYGVGLNHLPSGRFPANPEHAEGGLAGGAGDRPQPGSLDWAHRPGRAGGNHQDPPAPLLLHGRKAHPLGAPPHFASAPALALGSPVQWRPR